MIVPRGHVRMFLSWLRLMLRMTASRSYTSLLSVLLRLIRRCQVVISGKERASRDGPGGLALNSQPTGGDVSTVSVTLAVPLRSMPEPSIYITPPQSPVPGQLLDINLTPIIPRQIRRYNRNVKIQDVYTPFEVEKGPLDCSEELAPVAGWEPLTHPRGALFFYHPYKRVFTDANVRDPDTAVRMDKAAEKAYEDAWNVDIILHPSVELALEVMKEDDKKIGYYFVDHDKRVIFWFEAHKSDRLIFRIRGVERRSHVRYALESQYWQHVELFPNERPLPQYVVARLKENFIHARAENIVLETSLAPFTSDKVESMLSLMDSIMSSTNREREHSVYIVALCMSMFCRTNFQNFCGQPGARLDINKPLYGDYMTRSKPFAVINLLMFGSPNVYSRALHRIMFDKGIFLTERYRKLIDELKNEWKGYTLFSTVLLAVNISFLAVPFIQTVTAAILTSYLSTLCVMSSLVITLVFSRQVDNDQRQPDQRSISFMSRYLASTSTSTSIEILSCMLSLPFTFLIWGVILFALVMYIVMLNMTGVVRLIAVSIWFVISTLVTLTLTASFYGRTTSLYI